MQRANDLIHRQLHRYHDLLLLVKSTLALTVNAARAQHSSATDMPYPSQGPSAGLLSGDEACKDAYSACDNVSRQHT